MRISTKGRYAVRMMLDLATNDSGEPIRLKDVARRQGISEKYLEQIISILNKAGFVRSIRGPAGGYNLSKAPAAYTVGMILRLTEGSLSPVECADTDNVICAREDNCAARHLWQILNDAINNVVDHVTLEDLLNWQNTQGNDYNI
ncbi:MAG: Rrf2 family transcriptional regulator [Blautia sp.]|nr:Rrf2 family transcriptional regulator [Blautia sp.]